ncbi:hypothetical protein [Pajaroellobacter abortibovis]|uniref:Lipoprotein n=1 Tax=Pajaroellobacter abortibovis TaxID=1882918 RepID=A0A1L6MUY6_9BACT|nr:hypothetical protein [Pajaroellobacter abortibovis]APR99291.1 hypothetical protein BCY86_00330 [Pajaroellobacter abortibovis]
MFSHKHFFSLSLLIMLSANLLACKLNRPNTEASAQQQAYDFNISLRSEDVQMELLASQVAASERASFLERHKQWGKEIRIFCTELKGITLLNDNQIEAQVKVSWFHRNDDALRATLINQNWNWEENRWMLTQEKYIEGDLNLFGHTTNP